MEFLHNKPGNNLEILVIFQRPCNEHGAEQNVTCPWCPAYRLSLRCSKLFLLCAAEPKEEKGEGVKGEKRMQRWEEGVHGSGRGASDGYLGR